MHARRVRFRDPLQDNDRRPINYALRAEGTGVEDESLFSEFEKMLAYAGSSSFFGTLIVAPAVGFDLFAMAIVVASTMR